MILLAEDDQRIAKLILNLMRKDGYEVDHASDGEEALMYTEMNNYEVIILDWMMPHKNGIEVCKILRNNGYNGGVLMLTAKDTLDNKIDGLEAGADDYLIKPFEYRELQARVKALLRRSNKKIEKDLLEKGPIILDRAIQSAFYREESLELSKKEYLLFELLVENSPNPIPRSTIIDRVWGLDCDVTDNNLDAFVRLLRRKLKKHIDKKIIINVRGIGYKVEV